METIAVNLYLNYSYGTDITLALYAYKNYDFWIDLLDIFVKNKFPCQNTIINGIDTDNNKIIETQFFKYLFIDFIEYFYSLKINLTKDLFKKSDNSYLRFIISNIIKNKDDKIENYQKIIERLKIVDLLYENIFNGLFNDFIKYCIENIKDNTINNNDLNYIFKVFDFLSKLRADNKYDQLYTFIKPLIFEEELGVIKSKLEIDKYKDNNKIVNDIISILADNITRKFGDSEYEYLKFIKTCEKGKEPNSDEFKSLYFNLLNIEKLKEYVQKSDIKDINNYDLTKILKNTIINKNDSNNNNVINNVDNVNGNNIQNNNIIIIDNKSNDDKENIINANNDSIKNDFNQNKESKNIINNINNNISIDNAEGEKSENNIENDIFFEEQNKDLINNPEEIKSLKEGLKKKTIREYFIEQIKKYSNKLSEKSVIRNYQKIKNFQITRLISNTININIFPIVHLVFSDLLDHINYPNKDYRKEFGFMIVENKELLYTYYNDQIIENFLFESNKIKGYRYADIIDCNGNIKELKKNKSNKSNKSNNSVDNYYRNYEISNSNTSYIDNESYKSTPKNYIDDILNNCDLTFLKGFEFEKNSKLVFNNLFNLTELPTYFFVLNKEITYFNYKVTFREYNENLFSSFMETDGAYINDTDKTLTAKLRYNYHPFLTQKTFEVYNEGNMHKLREIDEDFIIGPKTIVINESKLSIPKYIKGFSFNNKYTKEDLSSTLLFTLNKLIKKRVFYYEYVKNEFLKNSEDISNYNFLFCLIYDNIPVANINKVVKNDLQTLLDWGYIRHTFKLKIVYLIPNSGSYNLNVYQKDIKTQITQMKNQNESTINALKKQNEDIQKKNQLMIDSLKKQNQVIHEQYKAEIEDLKKQFEIRQNQLLLHYNLLFFQNRQGSNNQYVNDKNNINEKNNNDKNINDKNNIK